jgi:hypothetical protein
LEDRARRKITLLVVDLRTIDNVHVSDKAVLTAAFPDILESLGRMSFAIN